MSDLTCFFHSAFPRFFFFSSVAFFVALEPTSTTVHAHKCHVFALHTWCVLFSLLPQPSVPQPPHPVRTFLFVQSFLLSKHLLTLWHLSVCCHLWGWSAVCGAPPCHCCGARAASRLRFARDLRIEQRHRTASRVPRISPACSPRDPHVPRAHDLHWCGTHLPT